MIPIKLFKIFLSLTLLTGCGLTSGNVEIDKQIFVFAMFINKGKEPDTVEVTISGPLTNRLTSGSQTGGQESGQPYSMITKTSSSIQDTLHLIQRELPRRINFGHIDVIVVGKSYAEAGLQDLMDWFQREPMADLKTLLMVAPGDAKEIAAMTMVSEQMPSEVLIRFGDNDNMISTNFKDCLYAASANQGYALTYLSAGLMPMIAEQGKPGPWVGIYGTALFQDHKLRSTLPLKPSLAISWSENKLNRPLYTVEWNEGTRKASVYLINYHAKKTVKMIDDHPVYTIKLTGIGDVIYKSNHSQEDSLDDKHAIEKELNEQIKTHMLTALRTSQRASADILQLGMLLDWKYPDYWQKFKGNWAKTYSDEIEIQVVTEIKIRTFGTSLISKHRKGG